MKKIIPYLKPYKAQLIVGPSFKLLEAILELLIPTLMVSIIDKGIANKDLSYILKMGGLMLLIASVGFISALICQHQASIASQGFGTDLRNGLYKHILSLSAKERDGFSPTDFTTRLTNDINALQLAVAMLIRLVIRAPFISIGSIVMALTINPKLALIVILTLPILTFIIAMIMKKTIPLYKKTMESIDRLSNIIKENLQGVRVIRAFARQKEEDKRFKDESQNFSQLSIKGGKISSLLNPFTSLVMNIAIILVLYFSGLNIQTKSMTQGEIIAFINYISYMVIALLVTANLVILFARAYSSSQRVSQILSIEESIIGGPLEDLDISKEYALEFDSVSFAYNKDLYVLKDISFKIKDGDSLGIIGSTGSGKTSLANLIIRHYDPNLGQIKLYDKDIKDYRIKALRENISLVSQKTIVFSGSIEENIRQGKKDATKEEIYGAAKDAQALEYIEKREDKFKSKIERGGTNLSGGQKQRLSIARALVKKPRILILDDSLSALDYATDARLRERLNKYKMTRIIISQRVNSVQDCNNILVLEKGQIIGFGNHDKLLASCIVYQELVKSQLGGNNA